MSGMTENIFFREPSVIALGKSPDHVSRNEEQSLPLTCVHDLSREAKSNSEMAYSPYRNVIGRTYIRCTYTVCKQTDSIDVKQVSYGQVEVVVGQL